MEGSAIGAEGLKGASFGGRALRAGLSPGRGGIVHQEKEGASFGGPVMGKGVEHLRECCFMVPHPPIHSPQPFSSPIPSQGRIPEEAAHPPPHHLPTAPGDPGSAARGSSSLFRADFSLGPRSRAPTGDSASISRRLRFLPARPRRAGEPPRAGVCGEPGSGSEGALSPAGAAPSFSFSSSRCTGGPLALRWRPPLRLAGTPVVAFVWPKKSVRRSWAMAAVPVPVPVLIPLPGTRGAGPARFSLGGSPRAPKPRPPGGRAEVT